MLRYALPVVFSMALAAVLMYPLCGALFRCGCTHVWAGAADHCNIHEAQGPHCPWCHSTALGGGAFGLLVAGPALAFAMARRRGASAAGAALAGVAALPLAALLAGALTFLVTDYPHFIARNLR